MSTQPLRGIRVIEFGQFIAGPGASQALADLGADVVKVESVRGDAARSASKGPVADAMFVSQNRGKRSLALDLKSDAGTEIAQHLVRGADVVITNMVPGSLDRIGLGPQQALRDNPRLVYASISGFPQHGPDATRKCFDIAAQAESGMMSTTGEDGGRPLRVGFMVVDAAAALYASQAVLAALFSRQTTGRGTHVALSLYEVALSLQGQAWGEYFMSGNEPRPLGNKQPHLAPAADLVEVADGYVVLSAYLQTHFAALAAAIGRPGLAEDPRFATNEDRVAHRPELLDVLREALADRTMDEVTALLEAGGVVSGAVRTYRQVEGTAQFRDADLVRTHVDPGGRTLRTIAPPYALDGARPAGGLAPPTVGHDSRAVLEELGYMDRSIDQLVAEGVVVDGTGDRTRAVVA